MTSLNHEPARAETAAPRRRCTDQLALPASVPGLTPEAVGAYRPRTDALVARITARVCVEVAGFADPGLAGLVGRAVDAAIHVFIDSLAGAPVTGRTVADYYWWLGRAEAQAGHDLDAMKAAHHVATEEVWSELDMMIVELGLSPVVHHRLSHAVMDYQRSLQDRALAGYVESHDGPDPVTPLLDALLQGAPLPRLRELANGHWQLPERAAVITAEATGPVLARASACSGALHAVRQQRLVMVVDATDAEAVAHALARHSLSPVAVSWGVDPTEVHHAWRWATRALRLARHHEIDVAASRVVRCHDHRAELLRHADPALGRHLMLDLLAPLLAEPPAQREALSSTMLLWLLTRGSAPALAAGLGVHDQTVRHRLRRIREMFGDAVNDPARTLELIQALHALRDQLRR